MDFRLLSHSCQRGCCFFIRESLGFVGLGFSCCGSWLVGTFNQIGLGLADIFLEEDLLRTGSGFFKDFAR